MRVPITYAGLGLGLNFFIRDLEFVFQIHLLEMVSYDELMRFITNGGTEAPTTPPCSDVAAGNSTVVGPSLNTGQGDRKITHCEDGAVFNSKEGKYSISKDENSSCNKSGSSSHTDFSRSSDIKGRESSGASSGGKCRHSESGWEDSSYIEDGGIGSSNNEADGSSLKQVRGIQTCSESQKVKERKIKPTFVTPIVGSRSKSEVSPRSKILNELRYHKNKPKQVPSDNSYDQDTLGCRNMLAGSSSQQIDPSIITDVNQNSGTQSSEEIFFARKSKVEYKSPSKAATNSYVPEGLPSKETIERTENEEITPKGVLNLKQFVCEICQRGFVYMNSLKTHQLKAQCDQKEYKCDQCNKKFKNNKNLRSHVICAHIKPKFQCGECLKIFPTKKTVDAHMKHNHMLRECKFCKKLFKNSNGLRSHVYSIHKKISSDKPVKSQKENQVNLISDNDDSDLARKSTVSKTSNYIKNCSLCGKVFHSRSGYIRHRKKHSQSALTSVVKEIGYNNEVAAELAVCTGES